MLALVTSKWAANTSCAKGDEMVELDMANYGNGDQGFFAMKNAYRRGEIDAQTFLAGKTAEVKGCR